MRKSMIQSLVIAAFAATASSGAHADATDSDHARNGCSEATLKGLYLTNGTGFTVVAGESQPQAVVHFVRFDGMGNFALPAAGTLSINGVIVHIPANLGGVYSVASDCTGSYQVAPPGGPTFDLYVGPGGSQYRLIQTDPGTVNMVTAERVSR